LTNIYRTDHILASESMRNAVCRRPIGSWGQRLSPHSLLENPALALLYDWVCSTPVF